MAKKIKIYERLLLGIALGADLFNEFYQEGALACRRVYLDPWLPANYSSNNFYCTVNRILRTGYIEKIIKKGQPYLRLTSLAHDKLKRDFPYFAMKDQGWDGYWRLVIFDISEQEKYLRDNLRDKLRELGFGRLQQSIYISPFDFTDDLYEFFQVEKILGKAFILTAKHRLMGKPRELANQVWQLDRLNQKYQELLEKIEEYQKQPQPKAKNKLQEQFIELMQKDPCLPAQLLPEDWLGDLARKKLIKLK